MARDLTLAGTSNWLFDNLASCFNYDTESPRAAEFDMAISLIWLDLLAKDIQQYSDPTVRSTLHALSECLYAYLSDIGALEMARDVKLG